MVGFSVYCFMERWVKRLPNTLETHDTLLFQKLMDLPLNGPDCLVGLKITPQRLRLEGPIETILYEQDLLDQLPNTGRGRGTSFFGHWLPVTFKFGCRPQAQLFLLAQSVSSSALESLLLFEAGAPRA